MAKEVGDRAGESIAYGNLGNAYGSQGDTEVGPPERDKTDRLLRDWNDVWVKRHSSASTEY